MKGEECLDESQASVHGAVKVVEGVEAFPIFAMTTLNFAVVLMKRFLRLLAKQQ